MSENRKPSLTLLTTEEVNEQDDLIDRLKDEKDGLIKIVDKLCKDRAELLEACEEAVDDLHGYYVVEYVISALNRAIRKSKGV